MNKKVKFLTTNYENRRCIINVSDNLNLQIRTSDIGPVWQTAVSCLN